MKAPAALLCAAALAILVTGVSAAEESGADKKQAVRQRIEEMLASAKTGDCATLAPYLAYQGSDRARRWKEAASYSDEQQKPRIDRLCGRLGKLAQAGTPQFTEFESEAESEGEWLVWTVQFDGDKPQKAVFAFLDIGDAYVLGDID